MSIFSLPNLKVLDLSSNQLTNIFDEVSKAKSLVEFRLTGNQINQLPENFGGMESLEVLDLKGNKLTTLPASICNLSKLTKLNLDENLLTEVPVFIGNLKSLKDLSIAKNKLQSVAAGALRPLQNLIMLDLHQNSINGVFNEVPKSEKLDSILLSYNFITAVENLETCTSLTVVDLHNNQLAELPECVLGLYQLKTLTISNNNLNNINPKIALIDSLQRLSIDGNPLRSIKPAMRNKSAAEFKKFIKNKLDDEAIFKEEKKQAKALGVPGASQMGENDPWDYMLREFVIGNNHLDVKNRNLTSWSPRLWTNYTHLKVLDLSSNPALGELGVPEEFKAMKNLQTLRMLSCNLTSLPTCILQFKDLQSLELEKNNLKTLWPESEIRPCDVNLKSLTYLNVNGNQLTEIPFFTKFVPTLKQLHLHMNKIDSVRFLCRSAYEGLETLDLGGNKIEEIPTAFVHFLKSLSQVVLINNDIQKLPNLIGQHKKLKNIQVDGNPLKSIRRPIIARGSQGILQYLADRYTDADAEIEEWAKQQEELDQS